MSKVGNSRVKKILVYLWNTFVDVKIDINNKKYILQDKIIKNIYRKPNVKSMDDTINLILKNKCSISRFGDGEFKLMTGKDILFQNYNDKLEKRLKEVLTSNESNMIICIPDIFNKLKMYASEPAKYWKVHVAKGRRIWYSLLNINKEYYNAFISRCYYGFKDKSNSKYWFDKIKLVWENREIVIIEGKKSRLGVGNDLFYRAKSIERILCPEKNAFAKYKCILSEAKKIDKSKLILIAVGPTATVLAFDLHRLGYQAMDIGHIDIEYEWYLMGTDKKVKVENKFVGEAGGGVDVGDCLDSYYIDQIIATVV